MSKKYLNNLELKRLADNLESDNEGNDDSLDGPCDDSDADPWYLPSSDDDSISSKTSSNFDENNLLESNRGVIEKRCRNIENNQEVQNDTEVIEEGEKYVQGRTDERNADTWGPISEAALPSVMKFTEPSGIKPEVAALLANATAGEFYEAIVDDKIISLIVEQTNLYATQVLTSNVDVEPLSRLHEWVPTSLQEVRTFLGLILYMGLVKLPQLGDYWSTNELYNLEFPRKSMSRNRFEILLRMIHFADNNSAARHTDRLYKINPLVQALVKNYKSLYTPDEYVCVDETLLPFRGRLSMKQYMKLKRHKYGVKIFKLCCGKGYTYSLMIYTGKTTLDGTNKTTPLGVVMSLTNDILYKGRTVITDNWYSSIDLAHNMIDANTHFIGTLRKNRKRLSKKVVEAKLKVGEIYGEQNERGICVLNWRDNRNVLMLSTKHDATMVDVVGRRGTKAKPQAVVDYNIGKGSVDLSDQMGSYCNPLRKSLKWFRKVGIELLLTTSVVNAYLLYKSVGHDTITITEFKKSLVKYLTTEKNPIENDKSNNNKRKRQNHTMEQFDGDSKHNRRKMCKSCYATNSTEHGRKFATNRTKKVDTYCKDCPNKPPICLPCFNKSHTTDE